MLHQTGGYKDCTI